MTHSNMPNHATTFSRIVDANIDTGVIDLVETLAIMGCKPFSSCEGISPDAATSNYPDGLHATVAMRGDVDDTALLAMSEHPKVVFHTHQRDASGALRIEMPSDDGISVEFGLDGSSWVIRLGHSVSIDEVTNYLRLYVLAAEGLAVTA